MSDTASDSNTITLTDYKTKRDTAGDISGRTLCDILDDMRTCCKTGNYSYLSALIEEAQYRGNRMEDRLFAVRNFESMQAKREQIRDAIKKANTVLGKDDCISVWDFDV